MQPFPEKMIEIGMIVAGVVGLLILIAPNFGLKPKPTVDGWRFPVKPTCLLLYYLALTGGIGAVAFGAAQLLASGTSSWIGWACFGFGFFLVPVSLADWPEPLILDGPFAETKEQLGGYYILDCADLDEAIGWAAKIPTACKGGEGCIEIRPIADLPPR